MLYIRNLTALPEQAATTGTNAKLTVGGSTLTLPSLRGSPTPAAADYVECADVSNATSCRAFDANNMPLNNSAVGVELASSRGGSDEGISVAYQPGTVNGISVSPTVFGSPDPHGPVINGKDLFKANLEETLSAYGISVVWVEDWDLYHVLLGEVHCGSNASRAIPDVAWWGTGR